MARLTRRKLLQWLPAAGAAGVVMHEATRSSGGQLALAQEHMDHGATGTAVTPHAGAHPEGHAAFRGRVDNARNGFDPHEVLRDFDWGKTSRLPNGQTLREYELVAVQKEIEVAPGIHFPAWTYNDRIPGPTIRAREGDRVRVKFVNGSEHPHTVHFHGIHVAAMDGVPGIGAGQIKPGGSTVYEFDALPFGMHLYHCHVRPLAEHIAKGMYGAFIIDPKDGREDADEMVMVMHGIDTNFDRENDIYAVNGVGFAYMDPPIKIKKDQLVRIYIGNMTEYDLVNSFHTHGNFFHYFPTGTSREPAEFTDTVMQCQGQRGIVEMRFPNPGKYMFHAHQSEFTELGWQGFFEVA